jgi:hypothetical protein
MKDQRDFDTSFQVTRPKPSPNGVAKRPVYVIGERRRFPTWLRAAGAVLLSLAIAVLIGYALRALGI